MTRSWPTGGGRRTCPSGTARATAWWSLLRWSVVPWSGEEPRPKRDEPRRRPHRPMRPDFRWPIGRSAPGTARPFGRSAVGSGSLRWGMVSNAVRSIWAEPRAPHPPARVWRDWVLVAVLVATAILEAILREDVIWRPVALGARCGAGVPAAVAAHAPAGRGRGHVRRRDRGHGRGPLFGADGPVGLDTSVYVLLLPYALFRWGPVARP